MVVCAHGYTGNGRDFDELARSLADNGMRVVCPDVAGRGKSDWLGSPSEYHFPQFLADLNALIARLGVAHVDWVGTSMGGLLGMLLAASPVSPIRRLVMNDVGAFVPTDALRDIARNVRDAARRSEGSQHARFDPQILRVFEPLPFVPGLSFWSAWYQVRCPVLLVRGGDSRLFPRSVADTMVKVKANASLVELPGWGHAPSLATAEQIDLVQRYLGTAVKMERPWRAASFPSYPFSRPAS